MGSLKRVLRVRGVGRGVARGSEMYAKSSATQSVPLLISSTSSKIDLYNIQFRVFHSSNIFNLAQNNKPYYVNYKSIIALIFCTRLVLKLSITRILLITIKSGLKCFTCHLSYIFQLLQCSGIFQFVNAVSSSLDHSNFNRLVERAVQTT